MISVDNISSIVYVIDADGSLGEALKVLLHNYAIQVTTYSSAEKFTDSEIAQDRAEDKPNCCLLFALTSNCGSASESVKEIHDARPKLPIIIFCDTPSDSLRQHYIASGAVDIVSKSMADAYTFTRLSALLPSAEGLPVTQSSTMEMPDGTLATFRMMTPDDMEIQRRFIISLSDRSRFLRFFSGLKKLPDHMLKQLTKAQFPIGYALIATIPASEGERLIGVARYAPTESDHVAEFAVVVADEWQGHGFASHLLRGVVTAATIAGIHRLEGLILRENQPMLRLAKKLGFSISQERQTDPTLVKVNKNLRQ